MGQGPNIRITQICKENSMNKISRRIFFKATALLGVTFAIGKYVSAKTLSFTDLINPAHAAQGGAKKVVPVVSDVDAHSQCALTVQDEGRRPRR